MSLSSGCSFIMSQRFFIMLLRGGRVSLNVVMKGMRLECFLGVSSRVFSRGTKLAFSICLFITSSA